MSAIPSPFVYYEHAVQVPSASVYGYERPVLVMRVSALKAFVESTTTKKRKIVADAEPVRPAKRTRLEMEPSDVNLDLDKDFISAQEKHDAEFLKYLDELEKRHQPARRAPIRCDYYPPTEHTVWIDSDSDDDDVVCLTSPTKIVTTSGKTKKEQKSAMIGTNENPICLD
ncbi:unnamed protein product [Caenorhabditis sp. 36 PRJEB53466]|nr:unnamed protein product [Caenorhabditis sp. 36 PRJEB53466]